MANVVSAVVKFYPVDGVLDVEKFKTHYSEFQSILWRSFYNINKEENCFDLLYPCKRPVRREIYENDELLKNYHIWIRVSDYSCYEDLIGFSSKHYKPGLNKVEYKCKYEAGFTENWNYASSCLYQADELEIKFEGKETGYLDKLIQYDRYNEVNKQLDSTNTWKHKMKIVFMKSSQIRFENDCTGEHLEQNFYDNELIWNDISSVHGLIINDKRIRLQEEFLDLLYKYDEKTNTIKLDKTINELNFKFNGKKVQTFKWMDIMPESSFSGWLESTKCDWSNCIDPEFIEFKQWYDK
jgi:hypothetical protein